MAVFSILTSMVLAFLAKEGFKERAQYFLKALCAFVGFSLLAGWLAYSFPF
jgi:hypothetical protein